YRLRQYRHRISRGLLRRPGRCWQVDGPRWNTTRAYALGDLVFARIGPYFSGDRLLQFSDVPFPPGSWGIRELAGRNEGGFRMVPKRGRSFGTRVVRQWLFGWGSNRSILFFVGVFPMGRAPRIRNPGNAGFCVA